MEAINISYTRIKTINGKQYKYLVTGKRIGSKVQQKVVKYLGHVQPIYKIGKKRKKSNASIYVRPLTDEERDKLKKAAKSNNAFVRDRARIILLSAGKYFAKQISEKVGCEERKVRKAIKAFYSYALLQRAEKL